MAGISEISSGRPIFDYLVNLGHFLAWRAGTNSRYSTGESSPIKARQPETYLHLGTACKNHHIYKDLNESSSARPGRSQQLEIPPSLNIKQPPAFPAPTACEDFAIRLFFCSLVDFSICEDFGTRLNFHIRHDFAIRNDFWIRSISNGRHLFCVHCVLYALLSAIILIIFRVFIRCLPRFRAKARIS